MTGGNDLKCWICGASGAEIERTSLGSKKPASKEPVCPPGRGCAKYYFAD